MIGDARWIGEEMSSRSTTFAIMSLYSPMILSDSSWSAAAGCNSRRVAPDRQVVPRRQTELECRRPGAKTRVECTSISSTIADVPGATSRRSWRSAGVSNCLIRLDDVVDVGRRNREPSRMWPRRGALRGRTRWGGWRLRGGGDRKASSICRRFSRRGWPVPSAPPCSCRRVSCIWRSACTDCSRMTSAFSPCFSSMIDAHAGLVEFVAEIRRCLRSASSRTSIDLLIRSVALLTWYGACRR